MPLLVCFQIGEGFFFHLLIGGIKVFTTVRETFMGGLSHSQDTMKNSLRGVFYWHREP